MTKLTPGGTLDYSTYLGGNSSDYGRSIAVDTAGNAYVTGETYSGTNFPTLNPFQATRSGNFDADVFVSKLNATGSAVEYSTYVGGSGYDQGLGIAVDTAGHAYVAGRTRSANFPSASAVQDALAGRVGVFDAFVTKLNTDGSGLLYSTYLGGAGDDRGQGIGVDATGAAYVAGLTYSDDFPTQGPIQATRGGSWEVFVTKLAPDTATNHPPVLASISNPAIAPGSEFTLTAGAMDPDLPADTLTFSLDTAPAGAAIDPVSGELTWTAPDVPGSETITVRVTDNGTPAMSDTETFVIHVTDPAPPLTVTNTADSGPGSLRQAITDANAAAGTDPITISFNLPTDPDPGYDPATGAFTIHVASALPIITRPNVILDGRTQTAFTGDTNPLGPEIAINGSEAGGVSGLEIGASGTQVLGLAIQEFGGYGIYVNGGDDNVIAGNYIGVDVTGTQLRGNALSGVYLRSAAARNRIGTDGDGVDDATERNLISGNGTWGVEIRHTGTVDNMVAGNYIGVDRTGAAALGNVQDGVLIWDSAQSNRIGTNGDGTADAAERNIISGNLQRGVRIGRPNTSFNVVAGNYIGLDVTGSVALGNATHGVEIHEGGNANLIGADGDGVADDVERNVISANRGDGITLHHEGTDFNVIAGNYIGTNASGTAALGNGWIGINLATYEGIPQGNLIGADGSDDAFNENERNIISGNLGNGIQITGSATIEEQNVIAGNYIGVDVTGTVALGNTNGIVLGTGASSNLIGTNGDGIADEAERNLISGNRSEGIEIVNAGADRNVVAGNYIGTDYTGTVALGNASDGIRVFNGGQSNQIGGSALLANTIAFNQGAGVSVRDSAAGNRIQANSIFANNALGIDLGGDGVTANDNGDFDSGPNGLQNYPTNLRVVTGAETRVMGTLNSLYNTTFVIDFYANTAADPSGYGEGQRYLGSTTTTATDGAGAANFHALLSAATSPAELITATATEVIIAEEPDPLENAGFETPVLDTPYYQYGTVGVGWEFTAGSGLSRNEIQWAFTPLDPPEGNQNAFLHGVGSFEQTLSGLTVGASYSVRWAQMNRAIGSLGVNDLIVEVIDPAGNVFTIFSDESVGETDWRYVTSSPFVATSQTPTLRFRTTNPLGGDNSTLIDDVSVEIFSPDDTITIDSSGLVAGGLQSFTVTSGQGQDLLEITAASFNLPGSRTFHYGDFSYLSSLTLNGDAAQVGDVLRLTPDTGWASGSAFRNVPLPIGPDTSFQTRFQFRIHGDQATNGADGFAFILQNSPAGANALGGAGGGLGYAGLTPSLVVEFDTWQNADDVSNNEVAVLAGGSWTSHLAAVNAPFDLNSGAPLNA